MKKLLAMLLALLIALSFCCGCGDEQEYEVTCPQCGEVITLLEDDLDFGAIRCPSCDAELEFDFDDDEDEDEDDD